MWRTSTLALLVSSVFLNTVIADTTLSTDGFNDCGGDNSIKVNKVDISFDKETNKVNFDVQGDSEKEQEVTATLTVTAYGINVFSKDFDPCDDATKVEQLCPCKAHVPLGMDGVLTMNSAIRLIRCQGLNRNPL
jgi:hypothetical protein